ncbi:CBS domain-containing protein [Mucilaginibacter sp.]
MLAIELVTDAVLPVHLEDTVQKVLDRMVEFRVRHMPVTNEQQFTGMITESDLFQHGPQELVSSLTIGLMTAYVTEDQHIYDVIRLFHEQQLTLVPVLSAAKNYLGVVSLNRMNDYFAEITAADAPGGVVVLEVDSRNNSLAHMAQIVESDNAQVLSSYVRSFADSTRMEVTLKLNKTDLSAINAAFLRYDYDVKALFNGENNDDDTFDRYNSFMNYLDF